ncbi:MAG: two-component sensor histidine kinase [Methylomonas sp.]|jgi:C4-dicarboxylate-specific signal transduction histidine kinase|nr:MAG: two-component sensor histidine kinase [Methylomonas sp.]
MRQLLLRPIIFVTLIMGILILGELLAIGRLTWLNNQRIHTIETDIGKGHRLQESIFELLQLQSKLAMHQNDPGVTTEQINELENRLLDLLHSPINAEPIDLRSLHEEFDKAIKGDSNALINTVDMIRKLLDQQIIEEEKLLINVEADSNLELQLAIMLPLLLFWIGHYFFRHNVFEPLEALRVLLSGLVEGVKQPIKYKTADPVLSDLFERYNHLVVHLIELEQAYLDYTQQLESQVRKTSQALLEQSQRLAKAERLAALTEMAASTAHELRNPLAIIQVALENMQSESTDPELRGRIGLLHQEVHRLTRHLNDLLSNARTSNEAAQTIDIYQVATELINLLSYQTNDNIQFTLNGKPQTLARLPEIEFRQVFLNVLQNAAQAIQDPAGQVIIDIIQEQQQLIIKVSDSGGGFNPEFIQQGIRPFVSLKEKGSGLGLVMVQRFIREQHGKLKLENTAEGHGCVTLMIPLPHDL